MYTIRLFNNTDTDYAGMAAVHNAGLAGGAKDSRDLEIR